MSEKEFHQQNLARIEKHITELKVRMLELQERIKKQEEERRNTEISRALFSVLVEHLEVMEIRRQQAGDTIRTDQIIGKTGCQQEA